MIDPADLRDVFDRAAGLPPQDRPAFLSEACGTNDGLRREVERLLAADARLGPAFDTQSPSDPATDAVSPGAKSLQPGTRLGPYEIVAALGAGGMGEVYRARDTRLDRTVAIKVLPAALSADPSARQRFDREARAVAALSHPHICPLFDVGHQDGIDFLVMEYLVGETLADRLKRGRLSPQQSIEYGIQILEALAAAHRAGIVHRDLKPANIMLTASGARVLDFGLAKVRRVLGTERSSAASEPLTRSGTIVGTLQYMAPEQLEGKESDARTDIFAFGAVFYEMVTGRRAFESPSPAGTVAAILEREVAPLAIGNPAVEDPIFDWIIRNCLAKVPENRWTSAHDVLLALRQISTETRAPQPAYVRRRRIPSAIARALRPTHQAVERAGRERRWPIAFLAAIIGGAVAIFVVRWTSETTGVQSSPVRTFGLIPPTGVTLQDSSWNVGAVSPDGEYVAFIGSRDTGEQRPQIWLQSLRSLETVPVPESAGASNVFWAPDSRALAFFGSGGLKRISLGGVRADTIAIASEHRGGTWNGEEVLFARDSRSGLFVVSTAVSGSQPRLLTSPRASRGELGYMWPQFLADGMHFVYFVFSNEDHVRGIYLASLNEPVGRRLVASDTSGLVSGGHLLFVRDGNLAAQPFDEQQQRIVGEPKVVATGVEATFDNRSAVTASNEGTIVFSRAELTHLQWYATDGREVGRVTVPPGRYRSPTMSSDGRYLAVQRYEDSMSRIVVIDIAAGRIRTSITGAAPTNSGRTPDVQFPVWEPGSNRLGFASTDLGWRDIYARQLDGAAADLLHRSNSDKMPTDWSRDGKNLLFTDLPPDGSYDLWALRLSSPMETFPLARTTADEADARFSPDSGRIAYVSTQSGRAEIWTSRFPANERPTQLSTGGGYDPAWLSDREVSYLDPLGRVVLARLDADGRVTQTQPIIASRVATPGASRNNYTWDVRHRRLLIIEPDSQDQAQRMRLIVNWPQLMQTDRAPTPNH